MEENAKIEVQVEIGEIPVFMDLDREMYALSHFLTVIIIGR